MEGRDGGEPHQPTNSKTPTSPHQNTQPKKPHKQITSTPHQKKTQKTKKQTKEEICSTKSQNILSEDNLYGICFLKVYLVPHNGNY